MKDSTKKSALVAFYQDRFNSRPEALLDYCHAEISDAAAQVGIKWESLAGTIRLDGERHVKRRGKIETFETKARNKVMAWGDLKKAQSGLEYPFLTFNHSAHGSSTWNGYAALVELHKIHGGQINDEAHQRWLAQQQAKAVARAAEQEARERQEREEAELKREEFAAYERVWFQGGSAEFRVNRDGVIITHSVEELGAEDGAAPYLQAKGIAAIVEHCQLKRLSDNYGEFVAVPLFDLDGEFRGLQRLYADKKLQSRGTRMDGAHFVIGNRQRASRTYFVEGFATGASVYLAEREIGNNVCVIITLSVDNLRHVMAAYGRRELLADTVNAADNDQWTRAGNAGLLAALDIHREHGRWAVMPDFSELPAEDLAACALKHKGPTDWNDYHVAFGLRATAKALRQRQVVKAEKDYFAFCLQRIAASGRNAETEARKAISAGMLLAPIKYTGAEVLERVLQALPTGHEFNLHKIRRQAVWLANRKMAEAQELRGFSAAGLARPNVSHLKIPGVRAAHGGVELPEHLADMVESLEGFIIVRAPMGSGKTEKLIAPVMASAPKAAYIAHRISLLDDAATRLNISHYQQVVTAEMPYVSHLACCVNSLTNPRFYNDDDRSWFTTVDTLCIDEASQVIRHTTTGPVESPVRVMDALLDAMANAKRVLLCDADANDSVIELCEMADPRRSITILEIDGTMEHVTVKFSDEESVWQKGLDLMLAGHRVMIASDSAEQAKKLAVMVEEQRPETKLLLVHADSKADPDVEAFLGNPSAEAVKYDVLIYSPAISSGVSMTLPHFQHHIGLFSGNTVGPSDAIQMLRRDRTARHYLIGIGHKSTQRPTEREAIWRGRLAADEMACELEETTEEVLLRRQKTAFDELYLSSVVTENRAKNNFANNLLMMLHADRYRVERVATDEELAQLARKNRKHAGGLVFERRMDLIESVETPTEEDFQRLDRMEVRSEREAAQIDRYQMENQLGISTITVDDVAFYDDRGIGKVVAMELLQATEEQARAFDKAQRRARVTLTKARFKAPARAFLRETLETLGVDLGSGAGEFTVAACRAVLERIRASQQSLELYNALGLGKTVAPKGKCCATTLVQSILARLGLSVKKRKSNGGNKYRICEESWHFIMHYVENRAAMGVHSLATHEPASTHQPKPAASADVSLEQDRDTLQSGGIALDEKYPLQLRDQAFAAARRSFKPVGTSLARLLGALTPEAVRDLTHPEATPATIGFRLAYAERLFQQGQSV